MEYVSYKIVWSCVAANESILILCTGYTHTWTCTCTIAINVHMWIGYEQSDKKTYRLRHTQSYMYCTM